MTKNDKIKFAEAFVACCMAFDKPVNEDQIRIYFELLSDYQSDDVCKAFRSHIKDPDRGRFFPKVADIIYQIEKSNPKQDLRSLAELEWHKALKASSQGRKPATDDQFALAALQMVGGPNAIGYAEIKELNQIKQAYLQSYAALCNSQAEALPGYLDNIEQLKQAKTRMAKV